MWLQTRKINCVKENLHGTSSIVDITFYRTLIISDYANDHKKEKKCVFLNLLVKLKMAIDHLQTEFQCH